jgi:hypothetical protein
MILIGLSVMLACAGCGGGADSTPAETDSAGAGTDATETSQPAGEAGEEDLHKMWGPEEMPDQYAQPLEFLYWRVDRMFEREDADADGRISLDEFSGETINFERIDTNTDGHLTKKEVIDDFIPTMREEGKIP